MKNRTETSKKINGNENLKTAWTELPCSMFLGLTVIDLGITQIYRCLPGRDSPYISKPIMSSILSLCWPFDTIRTAFFI